MFYPPPLSYLQPLTPALRSLSPTICHLFSCSIPVCMYNSIRIANSYPAMNNFIRVQCLCTVFLDLFYRLNFQSYLGKAGNLQAPIQPTLHASGFILVSSASYTCFCSLKQTTIVKHKGLAPNRLQSQVRCPPPVLQSRALSLGVLHPGLQSRPMGPEGGAQKHHF